MNIEELDAYIEDQIAHAIRPDIIENDELRAYLITKGNDAQALMAFERIRYLQEALAQLTPTTDAV